jgi:hypothetical protein
VIEPLKETTMLKKISAALITISMLAAPAMAAGTQKTATAPVTKSVTAPVTKSVTAPTTKSVAPVAKLQVKPSVRNANAKMGRHHHRHFHKHYSAIKTHKIHKVAKVTVKHVGSATRRG